MAEILIRLVSADQRWLNQLSIDLQHYLKFMVQKFDWIILNLLRNLLSKNLPQWKLNESESGLRVG